MPSSNTVLSGSEKPPRPARPVHAMNPNSKVTCTSTPAIWLMPTDAVAAVASMPMRCSTRIPSAMPPVPAGVMIDVNDVANRERHAGPNGTGSDTDPTNASAAKKYVVALATSAPTSHGHSASPNARNVSPRFASCGRTK